MSKLDSMILDDNQLLRDIFLHEFYIFHFLLSLTLKVLSKDTLLDNLFDQGKIRFYNPLQDQILKNTIDVDLIKREHI